MADNRFFLLGRDMAVDLGTANTLVYVARSGHHPERALGGGGERQGRSPVWPSAPRPSA